ncbi:hypothetical protein [Cellulomonas xiejunii]|uniref:Tetratricopeptide repeat protein n=1 Tax=Cellulomonas xiejunii TaxID=2968083 RepID=A0ABY5KSF2_9CELL|nr:hypothetical protein [Cellulomonas xiejunii]MCC2322914.1 hypothetical protein [Cellulomonas xiejunii]UUI73412.1 hypothetical protein NP048_08300 [Cellulomonas xiejunii]
MPEPGRGGPVVTYRIDTTTLREVPQDVTATWEHVERLERLGTQGDGERVVWLRILGALVSAERLAWSDVVRHGGPASLAEVPRPGDQDVPAGAWRPLLRLAQVLHWRSRHDDADVVVEAVRRAAQSVAARPDVDDDTWRDCSAVLAFADQGQGKVRYDAGRYVEAVHLFTSALERRSRDGAPADQVESSRIALAAASSRVASGSVVHSSWESAQV